MEIDRNEVEISNKFYIKKILLLFPLNQTLTLFSYISFLFTLFLLYQTKYQFI